MHDTDIIKKPTQTHGITHRQCEKQNVFSST